MAYGQSLFDTVVLSDKTSAPVVTIPVKPSFVQYTGSKPLIQWWAVGTNK
ncbi:MAG: hypothetical protein F6J99_12070 [Moorea sp. SIO4G3]|nr:hypothetical protein [Moorena sp. SIO4G3]